jgi:hypothetical protein
MIDKIVWLEYVLILFKNEKSIESDLNKSTSIAFVIFSSYRIVKMTSRFTISMRHSLFIANRCWIERMIKLIARKEFDEIELKTLEITQYVNEFREHSF